MVQFLVFHLGNDHTSMTAPLPVCSAKLSMLGLGQYYGGGPRWNPECCSPFWPLWELAQFFRLANLADSILPQNCRAIVRFVIPKKVQLAQPTYYQRFKTIQSNPSFCGGRGVRRRLCSFRATAAGFFGGPATNTRVAFGFGGLRLPRGYLFYSLCFSRNQLQKNKFKRAVWRESIQMNE